MRIEDIILSGADDDETIIIEDGIKKWSKKEIVNRIHSYGELLKKYSYTTGDNIAIISENGSGFIVMLLAILNINAVAVPIDPQLPIASIEALLDLSNSKGVCTSHYYAQKLSNMLDSKYILISEDGECTSNNCHKCELHSEKDVAMILFSSGTTGGVPKGVVLTHEAIMSNVNAILEYMKPKSNDVFYISKTMVHVSTLVGEIFVGLYSGAKIIAYSTIMTPQSILRNIIKTFTTIVAMNPTILNMLIKTAKSKGEIASNVRLVYTSGGRVSGDILNAAAQVFTNAQILNVYGLTEAGPRVCAQRAEDQTRICGTVGRPINGVSIKIMSDNNNEVELGGIGGIYVKSRSSMCGYYQNKELTRKKLKNGWLDTGDYGYIENNGELMVLGRKDDIIVINGNNVDPITIENEIKKMPGITECIVFDGGDDQGGSKIVAAIVSDEGGNYTLQDIISFCNRLLAPFELPHELCHWENIPMTINGKVSRKIAKEIYDKEKKKEI